jgi:hypothetical protein
MLLKTYGAHFTACMATKEIRKGMQYMAEVAILKSGGFFQED